MGSDGLHRHGSAGGLRQRRQPAAGARRGAPPGTRHPLRARFALGANSTELLFESTVLGVAGSLIGLGCAYVALRALVAAAPTGLPRIHEIGIDIPVLLFTFGLAIFTSVLIGLIPIVKYAGVRAATGLRKADAPSARAVNAIAPARRWSLSRWRSPWCCSSAPGS